MSELKSQALAMAGSWETGSFDNQHFMGHVAVQGIIGDRVNARFRHDITRLVRLRHDRLLSNLISVLALPLYRAVISAGIGLKLTLLGAKAFELSAGFLRIA